jgi:hypothetical protein
MRNTMARMQLCTAIKKWASIVCCFVAFALPNSSFASTTSATIQEILISEGLVYVYPVGGILNPPSCHSSSGQYYSFSLSRTRAKEYLAGLLSAQAQGAIVRLYGASNCDDQPGISERLEYFSIVS